MVGLNLATPAPLDDAVELIFLGTGTSATLPHVDCLTAPPEAKPCHTCLSTLRPEGRKNIRRNTSVAMRIRDKEGIKRTIIIDVGKSFQASAVQWFPKYGLRRIDAVLITHAHADAMNGLDDLRGWTLRSAIQPHVDLYVSMATFKEIQRAFPYLVSKEFASGGGDVPEFKWHIIEDRVPFEIEGTGISITPFAVHHGRIFSQAPPPQAPPTPPSSLPSTSPSTPSRPGTPISSSLQDQPLELVPKPIQPYLCFGFVVQDALVYISDMSHMPDDVWAFLKSLRNDTPHRVPPVLVLDCLRLQPHTSHLGIAESMATARKMGANRTYLTGFGHEVAHDEYVTFGEAVGGKHKMNALTPVEEAGLGLIGPGKALWVRPAYDGLRIFVGENRAVRDEGHDVE